MNIIKTALVLVLLLLANANAAAPKPADAFDCANIEYVGMIGGDPIPFESTKERYISFPGDVRFSHKTHK